jgi:hypothetical protein
MAAVYAALAIFLVQCILPARWKSGVVKLITDSWRRQRKVIQLKWEDIPDGRIHQCSSIPTSQNCQHDRPHGQQTQCWEEESSIAITFNCAWAQSKSRPCQVNAPDRLPTVPLLCTDVKTVMAFILCTAQGPRSSWSSTRSNHQNYGGTKIDCEVWKGIHLCHIQGHVQSNRRLRKSELEAILDGYPPWYRETFVTRGRITLPFPINSESDVARGGWSIALGLADERIDDQAPLPFYRCANEPEAQGFRRNGVIYRVAIERCLAHIQRNILPHFPTDINVKAAITMLEYLIAERTVSGIPIPGEFSVGWSASNPRYLTASECRFLMQNFNDFRPLDDAERTTLRAMLLPAMAVTVFGAVNVVEYLKVGHELKLPLNFNDWSQEVYLRDCNSNFLYM